MSQATVLILMACLEGGVTIPTQVVTPVCLIERFTIRIDVQQ